MKQCCKNTVPTTEQMPVSKGSFFWSLDIHQPPSETSKILRRDPKMAFQNACLSRKLLQPELRGCIPSPGGQSLQTRCGSLDIHLPTPPQRQVANLSSVQPSARWEQVHPVTASLSAFILGHVLILSLSPLLGNGWLVLDAARVKIPGSFKRGGETCSPVPLQPAWLWAWAADQLRKSTWRYEYVVLGIPIPQSG